jgi:hypothetical protein
MFYVSFSVYGFTRTVPLPNGSPVNSFIHADMYRFSYEQMNINAK